MPLIWKKDFEEHDVKEYVNTRVNSIENNVIHAVNTKDESEATIEADSHNCECTSGLRRISSTTVS